MDSRDDEDLFKRRLQPGTYDVIVRSQAGKTTSSKDPARSSGNDKIRLAFSVYDSSGGQVSLMASLPGTNSLTFRTETAPTPPQ